MQSFDFDGRFYSSTFFQFPQGVSVRDDEFSNLIDLPRKWYSEISCGFQRFVLGIVHSALSISEDKNAVIQNEINQLFNQSTI